MITTSVKIKKYNSVLLAAMLVATLMLVGCASMDDTQNSRNRMLLSVQYKSIESIEQELYAIRKGNGDNMSDWSKDTIEIYREWQRLLDERYKSLDALIKSLQTQNNSVKTQDVVEIPADVK